jgi:hypothetical protein
MNYDFAYVTIDVAEAGPQPIDYTLMVVDHYSGQPIEGAHVWLDGSDKGYTDENGQVILEGVTPAQTYPVKITKTDYQDSDLDILANDEITIPMPESE